jgi:membrane-associated phospholipid phosphatase
MIKIPAQLKTHHFDWAVSFAFTLLLCVGLWATGERPNFKHTSFKLAISTWIVLILVEWIQKKSTKLKIEKWIPLVLAIWVYGNLKDLLVHFQREPITLLLNSFDQMLGQPTIAIGSIYNPWLTAILALVYMNYLIVPLLALLISSLRNREIEFLTLRRSMVFVFFAGFTGYFLFPATLPRFSLNYPTTIPGFWFSELQNFWDMVAVDDRWGAFPSIHVAMAALTSIHCILFEYKKYVRILLHLNLCLMVVATVYFRQHWVLDIVAGGLLAAVLYAPTVYFTRKEMGQRAYAE